MVATTSVISSAVEFVPANLSRSAKSVRITSSGRFAFAFASERLPSVVTATISLLIPVFAGAFAFVILGEKVPVTTIPGSLLVVIGIVTILRQSNQTGPKRKPIHA